METRRKIVHILTIFLALLLRYLPPAWTALLIFATLIFNFFLIPRFLRSLQRETDRGLDAGMLLFPVSLLLLVLLFGGNTEVVAGAWALLAVADGFATLVGRGLGGAKLPWNAQKSWAGSIAFVVFGAPAVVFLMYWCGSPLSLQILIGVAVGVTLICAVLESWPFPINDNLTVPLAGGALLYVATLSAESLPAYLSESVTVHKLLGAAGLNIGGALVAFSLRFLKGSGAVAAAALGFLFFLFQPWAWVLLLLFFVLGSLATLLAARRERLPDPARTARTARGGAQVLAKGMVPTVFAFLAACRPYEPVFTVALVAAVAVALADTLESEMGRTFGRHPFLPTTFAPAPAGTPGAVTLEGTLAGILGAALIALLAMPLGLTQWADLPVILIATYIGTYSESYLGASPERRRLLGGCGLNFLATLIGALAGMLLVTVL